MNDDFENDGRIDDKAAAAVISSSAIILGFIVYWALQIESVRELLEMAYG